MDQNEAYFVFVEGLDDINLATVSDGVQKAAIMAINNTAKFARADAAKMIRDRYNFPGNYLDPSQDRLVVSKYAQRNNLEAIIKSRRRATSLARFIISDSGQNRQGVVVEVLKGTSKRMDHAFRVGLKNSNAGLAIRTKNGEKPSAAFRPKPFKDKHGRIKFWLLYGMSVNQAFIHASQMEEERASVYLQSEFSRLMDEVMI